MASQFTHKMIDGVMIELTPEEVIALELQSKQQTTQVNASTPDPGYGQTIKDTLVPPTQGPR